MSISVNSFQEDKGENVRRVATMESLMHNPSVEQGSTWLGLTVLTAMRSSFF